MTYLTYIPSLELIWCIIFTKWIVVWLEFYGISRTFQPTVFEDYHYPFSTLKLLFIFCEKWCKGCSNDYMKPFPTLSFVKKCKLKKIFGITPLGWTRVNPHWLESQSISPETGHAGWLRKAMEKLTCQNKHPGVLLLTLA